MKTLFLLLCCLAFSFAQAQPFNGMYTVDANSPASPTNYQSLASIADAISLQGISGNVTIDVIPGTGPYAGKVHFRNINGSSASATLMINGNNEVFTAVTTTTDRHVIRLENLNYTTLTNCVINYDTSSTGGFYGVHLMGSADHVTVSNCTINMNSNSTLHGGIVCSGSETSILVEGLFHDVTITGNTVTSGGYGASLFGVLSSLASNIVISDNTFYDWHQNGVYLRETTGAQVTNNIFDKRDAAIASCNAIQLAQAANVNGIISGNRISISQTNNGTQRIRGIYLFNGTGHKVFNNLIDNVELTSGDFTGIEVRTGGTAPAISFNTILLEHPTANNNDLIGIAEELSNTNSVLRNNLVSITQPGGGLRTALLLGANSTLTTTFNSNNNVLYVPGGNVAVKGSLTPTFYPSLNTWTSASMQDMFSLMVDPQAVNGVPTNIVMDNLGVSISGITTDITGAPRAFTPDIGAFEFLTVGISETESRGFKMYPNPAASFLYVELEQQSGLPELLTPDGRRLEVAMEIQPDRALLDVRMVPSGIYLVSRRTGSVRHQQKLVVVH